MGAAVGAVVGAAVGAAAGVGAPPAVRGQSLHTAGLVGALCPEASATPWQAAETDRYRLLYFSSICIKATLMSLAIIKFPTVTK